LANFDLVFSDSGLAFGLHCPSFCTKLDYWKEWNMLYSIFILYFYGFLLAQNLVYLT